MNKFDLLITGVGGQGVILASDIIGEAALAAGYDVKKTDTLGMAQRGGSVVSHVRIGPQVWSPLIKEGEVDILCDDNGKEVQIATRHAGDFIGEMAIFDRDVRSATVRAKGQVRVLTVDKKNFMSRIHEDPSLAFRIVETMSYRLRELQAEYTKLLEDK